MADPTAGPSGTRQPRKRLHLSLEQKMEVIRRIEGGEKKTHIARSLKLNESTIRTIYNMKTQIKACVKTFGTSSASARSKTTSKALIMTERYLEEYIKRQQGNSMPVTSNDIKHRALTFFKAASAKHPPPRHAKQKQFCASSGWLGSFITRKKLKNVKFTGERASADEVEAEKFPEILQHIVEEGGYSTEQIFNMDECGLQWKLMPKSTFVHKSTAQARGRKIEKNKITVLFCCNTSGSCKMTPLVIHTAKKPHAFRHLKDMNKSGVYWEKGNKAYNNSRICEDWFDKRFIPDARRHCRLQEVPFKVLLLMDNCSAHPKYLIGRHKSVKVEFLPANTTSLLQPLDQEVISNVKMFYQRRCYQQLLSATDTGEELRRIQEEEGEDEEAREAASDSDRSDDSDDSLPDTTTDAATSPSTSAATSQPEQVTQDVVNVKQFWKAYNIRHAINNLKASWDELGKDTINHSWRPLLPHLCRPRSEHIQTVANSASSAVAAARALPGCNDVTLDEVMEVAEDITDVSVDNIAEEIREGDRHREERQQQDDEMEAAVPGEPSSVNISRILSLMENLKEAISEADPSQTRGSDVIKGITESVNIYSRMHADRVNKLKQAVITRYFATQAAAPLLPEDVDIEQEEEEMDNVDDDVRSVASEVDFEGF